MMFVFLISAAITVFLLVAVVIAMLTSTDPVEDRLMEVSALSAAPAGTSLIAATPSTGLARVAGQFTSLLDPIRGLISGFDADLSYKLTLAGFRKPEHVEIYLAMKMLLPVLGIVAGSFFGSNLITAVLVGFVGGFFLPDLVLSYLVSRRQTSIQMALPDALDLLVICMEAGLGIDRSMAERLDIEFVRQFVTMLVQTERFGTPIANALGVFADTLRSRRTQAAEEVAAKTGVKLLFPLVFFIFPSIFVVTLVPAIIHIQKLFEEMAK